MGHGHLITQRIEAGIAVVVDHPLGLPVVPEVVQGDGVRIQA